MNGMIPYVDFADSKGLLLWLIYGLGYLLSPTNYLGVFWISCFWYGLTLSITYKLVFLFLKNRYKAVTCTIFMSLAFFNPSFHNEIRAEDFCLLFMVASLYSICMLMYAKQERLHYRYFFIIGFCFAATLMIKFNIAAMQAVFILFALYYLIREKKNWLRPILWGACGILSVFIPFGLYMAITGNFSAFIQEYFVNTLFTTSVPGNNPYLSRSVVANPLQTYLSEWAEIYSFHGLAFLLLLLLTGGILFIAKQKRYRWMPLIATVFIFSVAMRHHYAYYFNICSFLLVFFFVGLYPVFEKFIPRCFSFPVSLIAVVLLIIAHILLINDTCLFFQDNNKQEDFYKVSFVMSQVTNPRVLNAFSYEYGYGVISESLPAGKYWAAQNGMTENMRKEHADLIFSGKADFIIIKEHDLTNGACSRHQLSQAGYHEYCKMGEGLAYILFSNKEGLVIPDKIHLTHRQRFFKSFSSQSGSLPRKSLMNHE